MKTELLRIFIILSFVSIFGYTYDICRENGYSVGRSIIMGLLSPVILVSILPKPQAGRFLSAIKAYVLYVLLHRWNKFNHPASIEALEWIATKKDKWRIERWVIYKIIKLNTEK